MDYLKDLNDNQTKAAMWDVGPLLVLAGPGSGKTATLTSRVARLVQSNPDESFRILCLTFTRKAAAEMRNRLLSLIPDMRSRVLLTTFHSFSTDILRQHGSFLGLSPDFEIIEEAERIGFVKRVINENPEKFNKIISAEKALSALDFLFKNLTEDKDVPALMRDSEVGIQLQQLFIGYKTLLINENCVDYAGLLYFSEEILRSRPRLTQQLKSVYKYICVDEFQDTNIAQFKILRAVAPEKNSNLFIVGDDDQVIYQWNGASPARINELSNHYDLTTIQLPENYRCPEEVVAIANQLIQQNTDRSIQKQANLPMKKACLDSSPIEILAFNNPDDEARGVALKIKSKLNEGIKAKDLVVLARNSKLLERVCSSLKSIDVKAYVQKRKSQFESAPFRLIVSVLKLAAVRTDEELASVVTKALSDCFDKDILSEELIGLSGETNGDYLDALGLLVSSSNVPVDIVNAIQSIVNGSYIKFIVHSLEFFDFIESQSEEGREQFAEYPTERNVWAAILNELGGEAEAYSMTLSQFLQELALANKTPDAPSDTVRCLTIHASKGMEFDHVYLVGLAEDQLPSFQSKKAGDDSRELQEERRNCFVAITRTVETLTLTYAKEYNGWRKAPSRFLIEMGLVS